MKPSPRSNPSSGYTIVELGLTVIMLVALVAVLFAKFENNAERARIVADLTSMRSIERAAQVYLADQSALPPQPGMPGAWQSAGTQYTSGMMTIEERAEFFRTLSEAGLIQLIYSANGPIDLSEYAQSSSGLGLTFSVISGPGVISNGHILVPSDTGDIRIRVEQTGSPEYAPADPIEMVVSIGQSSGNYVVLGVTSS